MGINRGKKIESLVRRKIAKLLHYTNYEKVNNGLLISVTQVYITPDLGLLKIYISFFPTEKKYEFFKKICNHSQYYKKQLSKELRHHFKNFPKLNFYLDNSSEYINLIEEELKGNGINPIK